MALDDMITKHEAAALLGVDPRSIARYADKGYLKRKQEPVNSTQHRDLYNRSEVNLLKIKFEDRKELDGMIREIYAANACGMSEDEIIRQYDIKRESTIQNAMEVYKIERRGVLQGYGIDNPEDYLLGEEVKARLTIVDSHVIGDLIKEGLIKAKTVNIGKKKVFVIEKQSFIDYLGNYVTSRLYQSKVAAARVEEMTIRDVDKIAKHHGIGFKIKDIDQGRYLFNQRDIEDIRREFLRGNHNYLA